MKHHRIKLVCRHCAAEFEVYPCFSKQIFCSRECRYLYMQGARAAHWVEAIKKCCLQCGTEFIANKRRNDRNKKFCSYDCCVEYRRANGGPRAHAVGTIKQQANEYRYVKVGVGKWVEEHRIIVEKRLGRKLYPHEIVHHRNGNKGDNRDDNLMVVTRQEHQRIHAEAEAIGLAIMAANEWNPSPEGMGC